MKCISKHIIARILSITLAVLTSGSFVADAAQEFDISIPDRQVSPGESGCVPVILTYLGMEVPLHHSAGITVTLTSNGPEMLLEGPEIDLSNTLTDWVTNAMNGSIGAGTDSGVLAVFTNPLTNTSDLGEIFCINYRIPAGASIGDTYTYTINTDSPFTQVVGPDDNGVSVNLPLSISDRTGQLLVPPALSIKSISATGRGVPVTPVPEPGTLALLSTLGVTIAGRAHSNRRSGNRRM